MVHEVTDVYLFCLDSTFQHQNRTALPMIGPEVRPCCMLCTGPSIPSIEYLRLQQARMVRVLGTHDHDLRGQPILFMQFWRMLRC